MQLVTVYLLQLCSKFKVFSVTKSIFFWVFFSKCKNFYLYFLYWFPTQFFVVSLVLAAPGGTIWLISIVPSLSITLCCIQCTSLCLLQSVFFCNVHQSPLHQQQTSMSTTGRTTPLPWARQCAEWENNFDDFSRSNLQSEAGVLMHTHTHTSLGALAFYPSIYPFLAPCNLCKSTFTSK